MFRKGSQATFMHPSCSPYMPRRSRPQDLLECRSTPPVLCGDASPQQRLAHLLLRQLPRLSKAEFQRRLRALRASDPIQGPLALHWMFSTLGKMTPPGPDRRFFLENADIVKEEEVLMRRLRKGWSQLADDPWFAVHPPKVVSLPRYHSEPTLRNVNEPW